MKLIDIFNNNRKHNKVQHYFCDLSSECKTEANIKTENAIKERNIESAKQLLLESYQNIPRKNLNSWFYRNLFNCCIIEGDLDTLQKALVYFKKIFLHHHDINCMDCFASFITLYYSHQKYIILVDNGDLSLEMTQYEAFINKNFPKSFSFKWIQQLGELKNLQKVQNEELEHKSIRIKAEAVFCFMQPIHCQKCRCKVCLNGLKEIDFLQHILYQAASLSILPIASKFHVYFQTLMLRRDILSMYKFSEFLIIQKCFVVAKRTINQYYKEMDKKKISEEIIKNTKKNKKMLKKKLKKIQCINCKFNWYDTNIKIKSCGGCGITYYCGTKCQQSHWNKLHKEECDMKFEKIKKYLQF